MLEISAFQACRHGALIGLISNHHLKWWLLTLNNATDSEGYEDETDWQHKAKVLAGYMEGNPYHCAGVTSEY